MKGAAGALMLVAARASRRPIRWLAPLLGIALAVAFAGAVAAESVIVADQQARSVLEQLSPLDRTVRVTWQGPVTPGVDRQARRLLDGLGDGSAQSYVTLLNPVRLSGVIVRPAAIVPLARWLPRPSASRLGPCRPRDCPMLVAGGGHVPTHLDAAGVHVSVRGTATLRSDVPLGYAPDAAGEWPVLLTGDSSGLDALDGLSGVYRTHSWLVSLAPSRLHNWTLASLERRLDRAQATLTASSGQFSLSAPFTAIASARRQAHEASTRLLLAGGGAALTLVLFLVITTAALRREQLTELERLRRAGATIPQCALFLGGETGWLVAAGLAVGFAGAILIGLLLAGSSNEPAGAAVFGSVLNPVAAPVLAVAWLATMAAGVLAFLPGSGRLLDLIAVASLALLVGGVASTPDGGAAWTLLLAPLSCLAAGVILLRAMSWVLRGGERLARRGPLSIRLTLVGLARVPSLPAVAIASLAVSLGLGGYALAYRATLNRGAADQAADRVPLDALVAPGPSFATPLQVAPFSSWRVLANGPVLPVRRTVASYAAGDGYATVPALGVPDAGLQLMHGWRTSDGSAPLRVLASRLDARGPVRAPGPELPPNARVLSVVARSPELALSVTADLRWPDGTIRQLPLGTAAARARSLTARIPPGRWELAALELDEPSGLDITAAHQNGENPAPATQFTASLRLGPARAADTHGRTIMTAGLGGWKGAGAASPAPPPAPATAAPRQVPANAAPLQVPANAAPRQVPANAAPRQVPANAAPLQVPANAAPPQAPGNAPPLQSATLRFQTTGSPGILRPPQPFDTRPIPVLADPGTAAAAGPNGRLGLTVDQLPVSAQVVGVLRRFPTIDPDAAGFVVADEAVLASALDAQLPGQGRPDELWIASHRTGALRRALTTGSLAQLSALYRADIERGLRDAPLERGLQRTLLAAAAISGGLAIAGLLLVLLGPFRDRQIECDLEEQGVGPQGLRAELVRRTSVAGGLGVLPGLGIALILDVVAVTGLGGAALGAPPRPQLVTVIPWGQLAAWGAGTATAILLAAWIATRALFADRQLVHPRESDLTTEREPAPVEELVP